MKDVVFLHVGMHKTGSTTIQASLKGVTEGPVRYAQLGLANHSVALIAAFSARAGAHPWFTRRGIPPDAVAARGRAVRAQLAAELATPAPGLVLSGEELGFFAAGDVAALRDFLAPHARRVQVIGYVREPVGFAGSVFQQVVRHRRLTGLKIFRPDYRRRFGAAVETFGRAAVTLAPFDLGGFPQGCIVTDFCTRVGIDPAPLDKSRKNESLSAPVVALFLAWNRGGMASTGSDAHIRAVGRLTAALRRAFPGRFRLDAALVSESRDEADRLWVEEVGGFPLPAPSGTGPAVSGPGDLDALEQAALGPLAALLEARGVPRPAYPGARAMMDALYASLL